MFLSQIISLEPRINIFCMYNYHFLVDSISLTSLMTEVVLCINVP